MTNAIIGVLSAAFKSIAPTIDGFLAENRSTTQIFALGIVLAFTNVALMPLLRREEKKDSSTPKNRSP